VELQSASPSPSFRASVLNFLFSYSLVHKALRRAKPSPPFSINDILPFDPSWHDSPPRKNHSSPLSPINDRRFFFKRGFSPLYDISLFFSPRSLFPSVPYGRPCVLPRSLKGKGVFKGSASDKGDFPSFHCFFPVCRRSLFFPLLKQRRDPGTYDGQQEVQFSSGPHFSV